MISSTPAASWVVDRPDSNPQRPDGVPVDAELAVGEERWPWMSRHCGGALSWSPASITRSTARERVRVHARRRADRTRRHMPRIQRGNWRSVGCSTLPASRSCRARFKNVGTNLPCRSRGRRVEPRPRESSLVTGRKEIAATGQQQEPARTTLHQSSSTIRAHHGAAPEIRRPCHRSTASPSTRRRSRRGRGRPKRRETERAALGR